MLPKNKVELVLWALCFASSAGPTSSLSPVVWSNGRSGFCFAGREAHPHLVGRYQNPAPPLFLASTVDGGETERRLLDELTDLTKSFEDVQHTVKKNADAYRDAIERYQSEICGLEEDLRASRESIAEREEVIKDLESSKELLAERLKSSENQGKEVEELMQEEAGVVSVLEEERDRLQDELTAKEQETEEWNSERERLKKLIQEEAGASSVLEEERDRLQDKITAKEKEHSEWITERDTLLKEKDDMLEKISSLEDEIQGQASAIRLDMTKKYIDARAKEQKERDELREEAQVVTKVAAYEIQRIKDRLDIYESERKSLRKLSVLAWRRVRSVFRRKKRG